ncbi:MurR/RpiR family transcriptional regulator [Alicyclobacillus fastidiosus]|uniref:MurR/RpiR family transcriptional regulator n=1 Tax=Alicyclobacillus fastidiosus TaxID=392011 RepID=A0ABV5AJ72_9BACL|nr:MurR/RpiR family transcriptional regulator [Alicyclobacillus fastidiosus]WEH09118.1 MurR/RpiR family transcriptional regulator [Alicyclobacillus fastidiosus]
MGKVIERFAQSVSSLSDAEKHVLYYIEAHFDEAKKQSLTAMADSINVSTTTIIRMCQKLGLSGFSELKFVLKSLEQHDPSRDEDIITRYRSHVANAFETLRSDEISRICELMIQADRVIIVSVGLSKMIGEYFSKLLMQVDKQTLYVYESHTIDLALNMLRENDLVVFISSSGETQTILQAAEKAKYHHHNSVGITSAIDCTLAGLVSHRLSTHVQRYHWAGYDLTARSTLMMLVDILFESFLKLLN